MVIIDEEDKRVEEQMNTPNYVDKIILLQKASIEMASPFKNASIGFNWVNKEYPIYHEHSHWELMVIMSGEIYHNINGKERVLKKGDVCLIRPSDKHSLIFRESQKKYCQQINFFFTEEFARQLFCVFNCHEDLCNEKEAIEFVLDDSELSMVYDNALLTQNLPQEMYEMSTKLIVSELIVNYLKQRIWFDPKCPQWLNEFIVYINNPICFQQSMKELAECTPYSYSRLATLFKRYVGESLIDYINDKKMGYAKRLLRTTRLTTLQISETIGYSSLSSLNHLFKKKYGITPSEYRKEYKIKSEKE